MATKPAPESHISSPVSTGGGGTFFEQHVAAYWLAQLLVQGIPPILLDCKVVEVHLQTKHLGWHTDDFLVIGQTGSGARRKLIGQVKQTFRISAADEECKKTVQGFWKDFKSADQFSPSADRLALVTLRGSNALLEHFMGLLDCSRAARDGDEFEHRLATPGFLSARATQYCDELRTIIAEVEGRSVTAAEIWPFLRVLHVLSLDLHSGTRQTEAMIKTLLAHTTSEGDAISSVDASWNALLGLAGDAMPEARSFQYSDLPGDLRQRHSIVGGADQRALRALNDHTSLILDGIRSMIGSNVHLARASLVQQTVAQLEWTQVVLLSGPAGSGKSAVAKDAIAVLAGAYFAFGFRAEELAQPHFDETLRNGQIPANTTALRAILAGQDRKVLLIESVERLLEKSTRDAFTDVLTLASADKSMRIVLTCRDYSADLVRACFLAPARIEHSVINIPPLNDSELAEVQGACPTLTRPLANAPMRRILRNPYVLDKALQISWSEDRPIPESEREFRALFWRQVIRVEQRLVPGVPRRREETFVQIALRRARALALHVTCDDLDPEIVDGLRCDSLIVSSEQNAMLVAPAHDVLEDWAILQWIEEQHVLCGGSFRELSRAIGTHPAVRRTFRKWVSELLERDSATADRLFQAAVDEEGILSQFRDDTLVSLLRAPSSPAFLERHRAELLANNKGLLKRVIHLLRVACVTTPPWVPASASYGSLFNIPDGSAWAWVLHLVRDQVEEFAPQERLLLLGFIEDWSQGVGWATPYPDGAESVAAIAHWLLPRFDNYRSEDQLKRTLKVIAKIPDANREAFDVLLRSTGEKNRRNRTAEELRDIVFTGIEGMPAARDVPDLVVSVATDYLLCSEADLEREWFYGGSLDLETLFGIKEGRGHDFFPASAYRGPFLPLLRFHPRKGLAFIIKVFNHSADWYAHPRVEQRIEPPFEIDLTFADGSSRKQWCNPRLWNWYRGSSVGPYVLQSLLMALERWLLEFAEARSRELDAVLLSVLRRSESAALTAVVASIATAFPHASGETLLALLRSQMCIRLDRQRMATEMHASSRLFDLMPQVHADNRIYEAERKEADALPHRQRDLEAAIASLQLGPLANRVHATLDEHRAGLPPAAEQDDEDRVWRLAMHRMDLRQYDITEEIAEQDADANDSTPPDSGQRYLRLAPKEPEADVKDVMEKSTAQFAAMNARVGLLMWGLSAFRHEESTNYDPTQWRSRLTQARSSNTASLSGYEPDLGQGGPGIVAAVCARDHWEEMGADEKEWCVGIICSEVMSHGDGWNRFAREQRFDMAADRACAWVLPALVGKSLPQPQRALVQQAFVIGLNHPIKEVRWYATWGVARQLWAVDRELALRSVNALAMEATLVESARHAENKKPYIERRQLDDIEAEAASVVRQTFWQVGSVPEDAHQVLDASEWFGAEAYSRILAILGQAPTETPAIAAFTRAAVTLVAWWDEDERSRRSPEGRRERNYEVESTVSDFLQNFVMHVPEATANATLEPILEAVDRHPDKVHWFLRGLTVVEDRERNTQHFWSLWRLFADRVRRAQWLTRIDEEYSTGNELVSVIFLGLHWKEDIRHWPSLEGHAHHVHALFDDLPPTSVVLDDYVRFLHAIGEQSLPEAFVRIAKRLQVGDPQKMLRKTDTVFLLEVLLQRHVYGKPFELKSDPTVRDAVLLLLDLLVENGSSAAFRMRDDFVTPVSAT